MKKSALGLLLGLCFPLCFLFANINFQGLDLSADNRLLFRAVSGAPGRQTQHAVFVSRMTDLALRQITVFPEKMDLADNGRSLLIRSVFGAALVPLSGGLPQPLAGFPSFVTGNVLSGMTEALAVSRNGRWLLQLEDTGIARGNLVLVELATGRRQTISAGVEKAVAHFPATWSPDSKVFVYCKNGKLFYYPLSVESPVDEQYRQIGEGGISSVSWGNRGDFFYIRGSSLYHVAGGDLFTRALYADFLEIGRVVGNLPFEFDPDFDFFRVAPDSRSFLFSKEGKNIFYYPLEKTPGARESAALPYIKLPAGAFNISVLWPASGQPTISASLKRANGLVSFAWRLAVDGAARLFVPLETPVGHRYALSPDGNRVLAWGEDGGVLLNYGTWKPLQSAWAGPVHSCVWVSNSEYVVADNSRVEAFDISGKKRLVCLAGALEYGFEEAGNSGTPARIFARSGGAWYVTDGTSPWAATQNPRLRKASQVSGRYRVYLEKQSGFPYENIPMIRNTVSVGTAALLPRPSFRAEPAAVDTAVDTAADFSDGIFSHAPRAGHRDIAVCFDLYDDDTGLSRVLEALSNFGVRATFFLGGDFIRRHPDSARSIVEAGHEAASMFYAPVDLSSARYVFSADYIAKGLARNEDEFYAAAGSELALLWHPPFFRASRKIAAAASQAGYLTVGRDVDPLDWMARDEALALGLKRESVPDMIERIIAQKKSGSIIPIRLGQRPGGSDYLFLSIEVLLDALLKSGYSVVPVSSLVQRGR